MKSQNNHGIAPEHTGRWFWPTAVILVVVYLSWGRIVELFPGRAVAASETSAAIQYEGISPDLIALLESGQYRDVEGKCRQLLDAKPGSASLLRLLGEALEARGNYEEARKTYEQSIHANPRGYWARLRLAKLLQLIGFRAQARNLLVELVADFRGVEQRTTGTETVLGEALYLLERYHDSNSAYMRALELDPNFVPALIRRAEIFSDKSDFPYARELFNRALKVKPKSWEAMLGLSLILPEESASGMEEMLQEVLKLNPNCIDACNMLALKSIQADSLEEAGKQLQKALAVNPNYPYTLGLLAAVAYFRDDQPAYREQLQKLRNVSRSSPEVFDRLATLLGSRYRYQEAYNFARQALQEDPEYWAAYVNLGINQLRLGDLVAGKKALEIAFEHDPFDARVKNHLDLLDKLQTFQVLEWGSFKVLIDRQEAPVMEGYVHDLLEEASAKLMAKFRFTPPTPIQIEIYPTDGDFSVRTMGLVGIGALGACFGRVIVMDSPQAKKRGDFIWGSTLWHEYVHVLSLEKTAHRLPRWLSEGLSVMEERRGRPGWGDNLNLNFLKEIKNNQLLGIARLNDGFHRPKSSLQMGLSYYQASKVCEYLEAHYGWDKILVMLENYCQGWDTQRVFQETLKSSFADFDRGFQEYLNKEIGAYMDAVDFDVAKRLQAKEYDRAALEELLKAQPREFFINMQLGKKRQEAGDTNGAALCWLQAREAFPFYAEDDTPYLLLANLYEKQKRPDLAIEQLASFLKINEGKSEIALRLANLLQAAGRKADAQNVLMNILLMDPFNIPLHKQLGELFLQSNRLREAVREFQVLLALNPTDKAGAYYDLSRAYLASGLKSQAKTAVLKALEIAPAFADAQDLLLKIVGD